MKREEMVEQFLNLSSADKLAMLVRICWNMTIVARDVFYCQPIDETSKLRYAQEMTELYHQITQNISSRLAGSDLRRPDRVLVEMLYDSFVRLGMEGALPRIWDASLQTVRAN